MEERYCGAHADSQFYNWNGKTNDNIWYIHHEYIHCTNQSYKAVPI